MSIMCTNKNNNGIIEYIGSTMYFLSPAVGPRPKKNIYISTTVYYFISA